ncbi:Abi-alpha family protein [Enterobacter sp. 22452]|uniref:Abi-alpha family protein n=1 Tax=Enterobacter TaxID=547 RepID=UPI003F82E33B
MLPKLPAETVGQIYKDLFQPALRQFGAAGESVAKTVCLLSLPFVYGAGRYDQLLERVKKSFEKVPSSDLTEPPVNTVFQIAEKLVSMPVDDSISKMYMELLSSCVNKKWINSVHPAFVNLISQISGDEARFIDFLSQRERTIYLKRDDSWITPTHEEINNVLIPWYGSVLDGMPIKETVIYPGVFNVPEYFFTYLEHLHSLGVIEYVQGPEDLLNIEFINSIKGYGHWYISLSKFGRLFHNVCIKNSGATA